MDSNKSEEIKKATIDNIKNIQKKIYKTQKRLSSAII